MWNCLSRALVLIALFGAAAQAHEVQPAISDLTIGEDAVSIDVTMTLEAPLAGVDLAGLADTNDSANAGAYDRMRALDAAALEAEFRGKWPEIAARIALKADDTALSPRITSVRVPVVENVELPRYSTFTMVADLPPGAQTVTFGWDASMGGLIVRQQGVEGAYTAFLQDGDLSEPIARAGGFAPTAAQTFQTFVLSGFDHIIPKGLDHILFVLGLFLFALKWGPLLWQISAFTLAHTITLGLATLGIISIPESWMWLVEALIAISITYVAVENLFRPAMGWLRPGVVFVFGLLHGLGFASVLSDVGLPQGQFVLALLSFNVGVELGQLAVILCAFVLILIARAASDIAHLDDEEVLVRDLPVMFRAVSLVGSLAIAIVGFYWFLERIGMIG